MSSRLSNRIDPGVPHVVERVHDGIAAQKELRDINAKLARYYFELGHCLGSGGVSLDDAVARFENLNRKEIT
jgi:hypothetical protein